MKMTSNAPVFTTVLGRESSASASANSATRLDGDTAIKTHSGGSLGLAEWLELSWFYPEGFHKEKIVETERSWIVLGNSIVYKFLKVSDSVRKEDFFKTRWRLACEEILDNQELAPDLYVGLRLLRWVDEEPVWISEKPSSDFHPQRAPANADDVAIVMRRVPEEQMLHRALSKQNGLSVSQVISLSGALRAFHRKSSEAPEKLFAHDPQAFLGSLENTYIRPLQSFLLSHGSFLDPFSQLALQEVQSYLKHFMRTKSEQLVDRARSGMIVDTHGSLRADRIAFTEFDPEMPKTLLSVVFGRLTRDEGSRTSDPLSDIAGLTTDIEARGFPYIAQSLEVGYFGAENQAGSDLYRFYRTAEAVRRAQILFLGKVKDDHVQATSYLSLAFRSALALRNPFFLVLGGNSANEQLKLARSIGEMTCSVSLSAEQIGVQCGEKLPDDWCLEKLLRLADSKLSLSQSVVLHWSLNREEERQLISRFAKDRGLQAAFVNCQAAVGEAVLELPRSARNQSFRKLQSPVPADRLAEESEMPFIYLEASLAQPDLALAVLRELKAN